MSDKKVALAEEIELVVLVDEEDKESGTMLKSEVHGENTPLHRGFSLFLFDSDGRILVQQRAMGKITWPGTWSNSCCGHPLPSETYEDAIVRRVKYELGCGVKDLKKVSDYRYRFERGGVVENEVCPVYVAEVVGGVKPNPDEVMNVKWSDWDEWLNELKVDDAGKWSEWCKEEAELVDEWKNTNLEK